MANMQNTILISTGIVSLLPIVPISHFLRFGWATRRQQILSQFSDKSIERYKATFCPEAKFNDSKGFGQEYDRRYGRQLFLFPVLLLFATVVFCTYSCMLQIFSSGWSMTTEDTAKIAIFSLAGAYVWITYDLILRVRQNDVVTSDINRATLRLLVSLPFGFAISAFAGVIPGTEAKLSTGALAFFVGAFPTDTVLKFMRRTAGLQLKLDTDQKNIEQLTNIDGINVPIAERLIDEGIKTNLQLAYADPIALTIRTGMDFSFILDCCGQALVRMYFDDTQMATVRKFGLRTCLEVKGLYDGLKTREQLVEGAPSVVPGSNEGAAQAQLDAFAKALGVDVASTRFILYQIADDPYTKFGWDIWYF